MSIMSESDPLNLIKIFYQLKNFHLQSCGVGAGGSRDERRDAVFVVWIGFQSPSVDFVKAFTRKS